MEGVCFTAVRRGCGLYNLLSAVESIDILLSAVGVCSGLMVRGGGSLFIHLVMKG